MNGQERQIKRESRGRLFVLAGPSGAGKGTLRSRALADVEGWVYSISCTTRAPRGGERDGVEYRFLSREAFEEKVERNLFLEYALVHGNFYGTLREDVQRDLDAGRDVLLEIDVQGAKQVRKLIPDCVLIFISPPSLSVLSERLRKRGTDSEEQIALRLSNAKEEMKYASFCDHVVVNDELDAATEELRRIILSYKGTDSKTGSKRPGETEPGKNKTT
ncbi:MAG: guanylate kinase [Synergistaceae bacterium]|jgi:guanylate kinase|nr:guanylate kinase [Synergistaceae bacterium]